MYFPAYVQNLRKEVRDLRIHEQQMETAHKKQKGLNQLQKEEIQKLKKEKRILEKHIEKLKREIEKYGKTQNRYQVALFDHGNFHHPDKRDKKPNGGQVGHKDTNQDKRRDYQSYKQQRLFAAHCGNCGNTVSRVNSVKEKTLIYIQINTKLIQIILQSERQWCTTCHQEVTAKSTQSPPFTEYGMNTLMMIMLMRFKSHQSIGNISAVLSLGFGLTLSSFAILSLLS